MDKNGHQAIVFGFCILLGMLLAGCHSGKMNSQGNDQDSSLKFLFLGDSYTVGQGISKNQSWPNQLVSNLENSQNQSIEITIIAQTGWTTQDLLDAIDQKQNQLQLYDMVFLMIGVNDQFQNKSLLDFQVGFERLLQKSIELSVNGEDSVIVLSIPDWGVTSFAKGLDSVQISNQIDRFNQEIWNKSTSFGVRIIDVTDLSRRVVQNPDWISVDGLHPSGKMYTEWVNIIMPVVQERLETK